MYFSKHPVKLIIVVCQCRRCACSTPRRNNRLQAASRKDSEIRGSGCCGSGGSDSSDVEKVPQRVDVRGRRKQGSEGFGELVNVPNDDVEWDEEVPDCCK